MTPCIGQVQIAKSLELEMDQCSPRQGKNETGLTAYGWGFWEVAKWKVDHVMAAQF